MRTHVAPLCLWTAFVLAGVSRIAHGQQDACDPITGTLKRCFQQSYDAAKDAPVTQAAEMQAKVIKPLIDKMTDELTSRI